jgi:hypothetical protein
VLIGCLDLGGSLNPLRGFTLHLSSTIFVKDIICPLQSFDICNIVT